MRINTEPEHPLVGNERDNTERGITNVKFLVLFHLCWRSTSMGFYFFSFGSCFNCSSLELYSLLSMPKKRENVKWFLNANFVRRSCVWIIFNEGLVGEFFFLPTLFFNIVLSCYLFMGKVSWMDITRLVLHEILNRGF